MPPLGLLRARDLPEAAGLEALRAHLIGESREDMRMVHAQAGEVAQTPGGLVAGATLFGPGKSPPMTASPFSLSPVREAASVLLHDAVFVPASMTVIDRHDRLFGDGIDNVPRPAALAKLAEPYALDAQGRLQISDAFRADAPRLDGIALPVCGIGFPNYGHFLFDGLPGVLLHAQVFTELAWRIVGPELKPWQAAILEALGLRHRYLPIDGPTICRRVLTTTLLSMHVSHPTQFIRPLFDLLRFRAGAAPPDAPRRVFLSRAGHDHTRRLRNREAVEAAMQVLGFAVIQPDRLAFAEQMRMMGNARIVVGEAGAGMANIGFCPPGAKVLEIQPETFADTWVRGMCFQLAHRWHLYVASTDAVAADGSALSYAIDPLDLMGAVARIEAAR